MKEFKIVGDARELLQVLPKPNPAYGTVYFGLHSSPDKFAQYVGSIDQKKAWCSSGWEEGNPSWYGTKDVQEALDLVHNGWKKGTDKVEKVLNRIHTEYPIRLEPKRYGIAGSHPNVPRAISGNPLNMHVPEIKNTKRRKTITLLSNMGAHCGYSPEELCNRAAIVAGLVDSIEAKGYSCEVIAYSVANEHYSDKPDNQNGHHMMTASVIKQSHLPTDLPRLAFGLGHPGMLRRFAFMEEGGDPFNKDLDYHLGYPRAMDNCVDTSELKEKNIYLIAGVQSKIFKTEELAMTEGLNYIVKDLKKQGFPLYVK